MEDNKNKDEVERKESLDEKVTLWLYDNIKKASDFLGNATNRINGSNKSKAKSSIKEKITKFYYQKVLELTNKRIETLEDKKEKYTDNVADRMINASIGEDGATEAAIIQDQANIQNAKYDEKISNLSDKANEYQEKLNSIEEAAKVDEKLNEAEDSLKNNIAELTAEVDNKNLDEALSPMNDTPEISIEKVLEETQKENEPEEQMSEIDKNVKNIVDNYKAQYEELYRNTIISISNEYEKYAQEQINKANNDAKEIVEGVIKDKDAIIRGKDEKINSLTQDNQTLSNDLEQYKSHLDQANNMITEKDNKIEELNNNVNSLNETITSNQKQLDAKDAELEAKDKEIERLKVFEQRWQLMSQAMAPVQAEEEQAKTL